ncbi:hypothetical protein D3C73_1585350 [compost metagenome]
MGWVICCPPSASSSPQSIPAAVLILPSTRYPFVFFKFRVAGGRLKSRLEITVRVWRLLFGGRRLAWQGLS